MNRSWLLSLSAVFICASMPAGMATEGSIGKVSRKATEYVVSNMAGKPRDAADTNYAGISTQVTLKELPARRVGEKIIVNYRLSNGGGGEGLLKFEYFTTLSPGCKVMEKKIPLKNGSHTYVFRNTGKKFKNGGRVCHWRVSVLEEGKILCQKESALWGFLPKAAFKSGQV